MIVDIGAVSILIAWLNFPLRVNEGEDLRNVSPSSIAVSPLTDVDSRGLAAARIGSSGRRGYFLRLA